MNVTALVTALVGAACGALAVFNVQVRKRPWIGVGTLAIGAALLIGMVTEGNTSKAEHKLVFVAGVVLLAVFLSCVVLDARRQSRARSRHG